MTGAGFLPVWTATMAAMMLPSSAPLLRLDYATTRSWARLVALTGGYLSVWLVLGCAVFGVDALVGMHGSRITAALLAVAALYQLLPVKQRCLARCRAPLARVLLGWRDGLGGAARMGVENGIWCAGCCAGLIAALVGLGVMSWMWMSAVGATVLLEKATSVETRPLSALLAAGAIVWAL
jgi:predicted metal-binding membrane protein